MDFTPRIEMMKVSVTSRSLFLVGLYTCITHIWAWRSQCRWNKFQEPWEQEWANLTYMHQSFPDTRKFQHNERDDCPSFNKLLTQKDLGAHSLSLCPWVYARDFDTNRYPHEMFYARCSCKHCVTWDSLGLRHECKAHYHAFSVIRRVCEYGRSKYYQTHEYFPVACVCSHESMHRVS